MAFLLWNFYPAKLRPGAVGCQFLAGALGCVPLSIGWPGLTLPLALPYWLEGGMVALQIVVWRPPAGGGSCLALRRSTAGSRSGALIR